jgi:Fe-S-cluster containining protein
MSGFSGKPETDLAVISSLAEPHWGDNWNFRAYLQQSVDPLKLDDTGRSLSREIAAKIDCLECGNCCRTIQPHLTPDDVLRLRAAATGVEGGLVDAGDGLQVFQKMPCPLLDGNKCTAYGQRPDDCRGYPHLDKPDFLGGTIGFIENYGTCPIVFNTLNHLKTLFAYDPAKDYIGDRDPEATHGSSFGR